MSNFTLIVDSRCSSAKYNSTFDPCNIKTQHTYVKESKKYKKQPYGVKEKIEIPFSLLCDSFMIKCNYVKTFSKL